MKYTILILTFLVLTSFVQAQQKDTLIVIRMTLPEYRAWVGYIDGSIDSKKTTNDIVGFIQKKAKLVPPTTDTTTQRKPVIKNK
jgi:hypothetical protein